MAYDIEQLDKENSRLLSFNEGTHVRKVQKKAESTTSNASFEPAMNGSAGSDFDL